MTRLARIEERYRRTGADLPGGDPRPSHGAEMEGYFWRVTDVARQRVIVALCGINRHPDGDWATVAIAAHPAGFVRSAVLDHACARSDRFHVSAGDGAFVADERSVHVDLGDGAAVDLSLADTVGWPHRLGAGGIFSALPFLGQYWHPHVLGGRATGAATIGHETWTMDGADVYAEKNWGAGFPEQWWWGQAQAFDRPDVCVAFGGGLLTAGPLRAKVGGIVVRVGDEVIRMSPPFASVRSTVQDDTWTILGRTPTRRVHIVGHGLVAPHVLPVPLPAQRRNIDTDFEHLAGHLELTVSGRGASFRGFSDLAGLEVGHRPTAREMATIQDRTQD